MTCIKPLDGTILIVEPASCYVNLLRDWQDSDRRHHEARQVPISQGLADT